MANKPSRRRRSIRLLKGSVKENQVLGALNDQTGVLGVLTDTVEEKAFLLSAEATYTLMGHIAGEGPISVYWCHTDYTLAEIEEFIENTQSWSSGDLVQQEIAKRKIRFVGTFSGETTDETLQEGKVIKTALKWVVNSGDGAQLCLYNDSGAQLTTGAAVRTIGYIWIKPI